MGGIIPVSECCAGADKTAEHILEKLSKNGDSATGLLDQLDEAVGVSGRNGDSTNVGQAVKGENTNSGTTTLSKTEKSQLQHGFNHVSDKFESFDEFVDYSTNIPSQQGVSSFSDTLRGNRAVNGYYDSKRGIITYYDKKSSKYVTSISPSQRQIKNKGIK